MQQCRHSQDVRECGLWNSNWHLPMDVWAHAVCWIWRQGNPCSWPHFLFWLTCQQHQTLMLYQWWIHIFTIAHPRRFFGGDFLLHTIIPHQKLVGYYCKYSKYMVWCAWWHTTLRHSPSSHRIKGRLAKLRKGGCHESYYYIPKTMHSRTVRLRADS